MTTKASESSNVYKVALLVTMFLSLTFIIFSRYILIFFYSTPVADLTPEEAKYQSIKEALHLTASQYGLLVGPCFMAVFCVFNLFSGYVADSFNRRNVMLVGLALSATSILTIYFTQNFWQLMGGRALLGLGQSAFAPIGYSIINQYFTTNRTLASSIFASGVYAGYGMSSLILLVLPHWGWRNTALYTACLGGAMACLFLLVVREPERAQPAAAVVVKEEEAEVDYLSDKTISINDDEAALAAAAPAPAPPAQLSWIKSVLSVLTSRHVWVVISILIPRLAAGGVIGSFFPILMKNRFPTQKEEFASLNCAVVSVAGVLSGILGGIVCDKWVQSSKNSVAKDEEPLLEGGAPPAAPLYPYLRMAGFSCLTCLPFFALTFMAQNLYVGMTWLFVAYLFSECYFAPLLSFLYASLNIQGNVKSTAVSVSIGLSQFISSFAAVIVGYIHDEYAATQTELLIGFLAPTALAGIVAIICSCVVKNQ